jgi:hypothetical protein
MQGKNIRAVSLAVAVAAGTVAAQKVSFEMPVAWLSYRSDTVTVKAHLDTANIKQRKLSLTLLKFHNGKKSKVASTTLDIISYTHDVTFGSVGTTLFGGTDFLALEWSIPKTDDKGSVAPFGISDIEHIDHGDTVFIKKAASPLTPSSVARGDLSRKIGGRAYGLSWNSGSVQCLCDRSKTKNVLVFAYDIKNAKSAFGSYPERFVAHFPAHETIQDTVKSMVEDTIKTWFYTRQFKSDSISYAEKAWHGAMEIGRSETAMVITIPHSDLGFLPFDGRCVGFAVFEQDESGKKVAAFPPGADMHIPGSWGNLVLKD